MMHDQLQGFSIDSADLPPLFKAPWFKRERFQGFVDSSRFSQTDDPYRLQMSGAVEVASALVEMAESCMTDPRQRVREAAHLLYEYIAEKHYEVAQKEGLDLFLGLRRRDGKGSLTFRARQATRDAVVAEMAVADRWSGLSARDAAKDIKREYDRHGGGKKRKSRPVLEPESFFWRIAQTKRGLPNIDDMTAAIRAARQKSGLFSYTLL